MGKNSSWMDMRTPGTPKLWGQILMESVLMSIIYTLVSKNYLDISREFAINIFS